NTAFIDFVTVNQAAPQVSTGAATSVSGTGATLHGSVNPLGSTTTALIQYSTDPSFTPTVASTVGSGFGFPTGVAADAAGNGYVAATGNSAVKKVLPDGTIQTIGSGFNNPWDVAADAAGNVYVADTGNSAVKKVLPDGTIQTIGSGFNNPQGLAVDA